MLQVLNTKGNGIGYKVKARIYDLQPYSFFVYISKYAGDQEKSRQMDKSG
jgi:hypothetical protein